MPNPDDLYSRWSSQHCFRDSPESHAAFVAGWHLGRENVDGFFRGTLSLITLALIAMKLFSVIGWSWWWVLSPIWVPAVIAVLSIVAELFYLRHVEGLIWKSMRRID